MGERVFRVCGGFEFQLELGQDLEDIAIAEQETLSLHRVAIPPSPIARNVLGVHKRGDLAWIDFIMDDGVDPEMFV